MNTKQLLIVALGSTLLLAPSVLKAQESVADAARRTQAAKKAGGPKAKITLDNDNLNTLTGTISVVGQEPASPATAGTAATADKAAAPATPADKPAVVKDESYWRRVFAEANKILAEDARELDILQREYNLKEQQYYSDPNTAMKEQYNRQDLTDTKTKIDEKTAAVAADKQTISDLEDALRQAGGDPGWANPAPTLQPPAL